MTSGHIEYEKEFVLVVDDEEIVSDPIVQMLRHLGFQAESASNGNDALKALNEKRYTFLLTDIRMPQMKGLDLIRRTRDECPHVMVIAMTGYPEDYSYVDVIEHGASDFITKPFQLPELEARIRRIIIERNTQQELKRLSTTDSLTGLYNQRHFYDQLWAEVERAKRQTQPLGLIFLDLDDFKQYNDTHGHLDGDKLLEKVGSIINTKIRQGVDSGYRYGGDEFAIILIDAEPDIIQSIRKRIETSIKEKCNLNVSIGSAKFTHGLSPEEFLTKADNRLYEAKATKNGERSNVRFKWSNRTPNLSLMWESKKSEQV